jgi:hypothetical protein
VAFGATHYNWRPDVHRLVRRFQFLYRTKANTYKDHPTGMHLDAVSVDFWAPAGRGVDIAHSVGDRIFRRLRRRRRAPYYRWIIWRGRIYYPNGTDYRYQDLSDQHFDHVHVTFW